MRSVLVKPLSGSFAILIKFLFSYKLSKNFFICACVVSTFFQSPPSSQLYSSVVNAHIGIVFSFVPRPGCSVPRVLLFSFEKHRLPCFERKKNKKLRFFSPKNMDVQKPEHEDDALALLALKTGVNNVEKPIWSPVSQVKPVAKLEGREFEYLVRQNRISIGRNSSLGSVDVNMGHSSFVSRRHLEITFDSKSFFLKCNGKNGIFVDGTFHRRGNSPLKLPATWVLLWSVTGNLCLFVCLCSSLVHSSSCVLRFPSTNVKIWFTALLDENVPRRVPSPPKGSKSLPSLKIKIPNPESNLNSPVPSPTGTIR